MDLYISHIGTKRHSGRYPWGSGDDPYQNSKDALAWRKAQINAGVSDVEMAKLSGFDTVNEFKRYMSSQSMTKAEYDKEQAIKYHAKGMSDVAIAARLNLSDKTVKALYSGVEKTKNTQRANTAKALEDSFSENVKYLDVGKGSEAHLGVTQNMLNSAVKDLEDSGKYTVLNLQIPKPNNPTQSINMKVLAPAGTKNKQVYDEFDKVNIPSHWSTDSGLTFKKPEPPISIDPKRVQIKYAEEGGIQRDGLIEIRRDAKDLSMGDSSYMQVRILVGKDRYLKGMAIYADDLPPGVDIRFNTNKTKANAPGMEALKEIKTNPDGTLSDLPFGAVTKQHVYTDANGQEQRSALNIVNKEGDWSKWSKDISSQMVTKQSPEFAKKLLNEKYERHVADFDEIMKLSNPAIKQKLLDDLAGSIDSQAADIKASMPSGSAYKVIVPFPQLKDNEIYAPHLKDGTKVVLIRFPHAGKFEIPELTVNNNVMSVKKQLPVTAKDAVGINANVAERLSGADFDGDSVIVMPNNKGEIKSSPALKDMEGFDAKTAYSIKSVGGNFPDKKKMGLEMGKISNLITDMSFQDPSPSELARAVKYSQVAIDSHKHKLNIEKAYNDFQISNLYEKYQGKASGGASTIISKGRGKQKYNEYKEKVDPETGKIIREETGRTYSSGKKILQETRRLKMVDDAMDLVSPNKYPMEIVYAEHANKMKDLANKIRVAQINTANIKQDPQAKLQYASEIESLKEKLTRAQSNSPNERKANLITNAYVRTYKANNPDADKKEIKKQTAVILDMARNAVGAKKDLIEITDREWEAMQAGAVSHSMQREILANTNEEAFRQRAMPRPQTAISAARVSRVQQMLASGNKTPADIADFLGVSTSTVYAIQNGEIK